MAWTGNFDNWRAVLSDLAVAVNRALDDEGIRIPFPQRDLHVYSVEGQNAASGEQVVPLPVRDATDG